ncbi:outer membrane protein [Legionella birminghamensis]|uniref:Cell division coordinator CpoB n=1 Tax=Legionella birminghamensis TaxID=28083 RepID=A0A378I717_9GAMM|nr:tol-pal system protein YbgF [Legionella birminghamensis]KTC76024.1 outer membrane protein [Legionella birminghamensis]STX30813.1 outer membrane protein [Legionella birminghamensis]
MIQMKHRILALCFAGLLPLQVAAEAPVVDDSENFAILDEQQADMEQQPVAKAQLDDSYPEEEIALAQDNELTHSENAELLDRLQGMKQEIQELRGQLEVQAHELKQLQQQQLSFYKDLDSRLSNNMQTKSIARNENSSELNLASKAAPTVSKTPTQAVSTNSAKPIQAVNTAITEINPAAVPSAKNNPADEQLSYLAAYELVKSRHFDDALASMTTFVTQYPHGGYTANAHYWLGELYMVKKNYNEAINHFEVVLKQFPSSSKAAACTLKIGYAQAASGKEIEAKQSLQQVLKNYPDTPTAQLALAKLHSLSAS